MSEEIPVQVVAYPDREHLVLRWRDPITNKFKTKSAKTSDRNEANKAAGALQTELLSGKHQAASKLTWEAFKERLVVEYYPTISVATQKKANTVLDSIDRILHPQKLSQLTNEKLSYYVSQLRCEMMGKGDKAEVRSEATVQTYVRLILTFLRWAHDLGMIANAPKVSKASRSKANKVGKARAVTAEEFDRMLAAVPKALVTKLSKRGKVEPTAAVVDLWRFFLRGLWFSGFRLGEALRLSWTDEAAPHVDLTGRRPVVRFPAGSQKSGNVETWPCPPDFAGLLASVPEAQRRGRVFRMVTNGSDGPTQAHLMRVLSAIGKAAGVVVAKSPKATKYASAHDLRRAFCTRWSRLVMPQVLTRLARHHSISTTMAYYVTQSAEDTADLAYQAWERKNVAEVTNQVTLPKSAPEQQPASA